MGPHAFTFQGEEDEEDGAPHQMMVIHLPASQGYSMIFFQVINCHLTSVLGCGV
jgi:hypothetical protein